MNMHNAHHSESGKTALKWGLLTLTAGGAALSLAWMLWGTLATQPSLADHHERLNPSPNSAASVDSALATPGAHSVPQPLSDQPASKVAATQVMPSIAPMAPLQQAPDSPEVDLATQARLALQSGSAEAAFKAAADIRSCDGIDGVVALAYTLPLENKPAHQIALKTILEDQRRCQALDEAAKALYEPLLLKAFEGGSRNAARSMATKAHLLAKFSLEQKARVVQAVKIDAAQGDVTAISSLSNASASLGTSLQDDYAYALAFKSIRQEEGKDSKYFGAFPKEYFLAWDEELKFKEQQLSKTELEQARQQAEAVLRSYREARSKKRP